MFEIDWYGNGGYFFPDPGKVKTVKCGVCNSLMKVERNLYSATSWAESMARRKHKHDYVFCPNLKENWHKRIYRLKMGVYHEEIRHHNEPIGLKKMKKAAKKEILKLLKTHAAR